MTNTVCPHYTYPLSLLLHSIGGVPPFFFIAIAVTPLAELHADLFSRYASPLDFCVFVAVDKRGEGVTSTRFVVDATESSKEGGVAAELCSSQTGL